MEYKFDKLTYKNGDQDLIIIMKEKKYRLAAQFLMSDIQGSDPSYVLEAFDRVINSKSDYEEINGNVCGVEIHQEKTQIFDNLADEDDMGACCEVSTIELRDLVKTWSLEVEKFREMNK